jgi:hypothetical protein
LDPTIKKCLITHHSLTTRIYGKPKIHKKYIPLRPIVSAIGSPTYSLLFFLPDKLVSFMGKTPSFIKESSDFIKKTHGLHLDEHDVMVSFDVV